MKNISSAILAGLLSMFFISCDKSSIVQTGTLATVPTVTISAVTNITVTTAVSGGVITSDGGATVTSSGVCWSTNHAPTTTDSKATNGTATSSFTSAITGLSANTNYYVRAYAINNKGIAYSSELSFLTLEEGGSIIFNSTLTYGSVTDIDGNVYKTIQIGTQTWMAENLKSTKYRNGDAILNMYNNDIATKSPYGAFYDENAVVDNRNIAPAGWHVCTENDVLTLVNYLGGYSVAGGKLKETGITHWRSPNTGATNETGFTALPGSEGGGDSYSVWWYTSVSPGNWSVFSTSSGVAFDYYNPRFSVRCVKD
jgi:uncharacterized protein (TIGR02145 family)